MNTVVYYPYASPSADWLKIAALCWDTVYRIKPPSMHADSDEIQELNETFGGILKDVRLRQPAYSPADPSDAEFSSQLGMKFREWLLVRTEALSTQPMSPEEGKVLASMIGLHSSKFPDHESIELLEANGLIKYAYVQVEGTQRIYLKWELDKKLPGYEGFDAERERYSELIEEGYHLQQIGKIAEGKALLKEGAELRERNVVFAPELRKEILMPQDVAFHYLSLYANLAAADLNSDVATDVERFTETILYDSRSLRSEIAKSVLEAHIPANLSEMDPSRISEFREEFSTQRLKYAKEVQSITREYSEVASEGQLTQIKKRIVDIALERCEETKRSYQRAKLDMVVKSVAVTLTPPAIATTIASALGIGLFAPAGIAAALALFVAARLIEWDRSKAERNKSPWSYVLDARKL